MQRHPALRKLSSEHHTGLVLARRARQAVREGAAQSAAWEAVKERFRAELDGHFRREELGLLPALLAVGEVGLVERTLREHQALRALVDEDRVENLIRFADLLTAHIRFEEGPLFDAAQRQLAPSLLAALEPILEQRPPGSGGGCEPKG